MTGIKIKTDPTQGCSIVRFRVLYITSNMSRLKGLIHKTYTPRNKVRLIRGGRNYFTLLHELIDSAAHTLHLQFYIFTADDTGLAVVRSLQTAAARGVAVFLHLDAYASQQLPQKTVNELRAAGVQVKWFAPFFKSRKFYFGRRLHHKVVVADGFRSLTGGLNICDRYNDLPGSPAWLDMAVYCEGEASYIVYHICRKMWGEKELTPAIGWKQVDDAAAHIPENERMEVRVRQNDWVKRKVQIWRSYMELFTHSEKQLTIMCSYFLPGVLYRRKLAAAVRRGVKVQVILAGISDISLAKHAERFLYGWMLKNNIAIYEYQGTVLHAKMATCDDDKTTIGSYNVNNISAYASLELNLDIRNKEFTKAANAELERIILQSRQITKENYLASTGFFRRAWQRFSYWFFNTVLKLFTFYFRQE